MIIKKDTIAADPSPRKGSSLSLKSNQDLFSNSAFSAPAKRMITRTYKMPNNRPHHASKEMVRRALTPPVRRLSWRWLDFQPTPSRLSVMSMAI